MGLEAGRDLNKLIAEKIMELEVIITEYNKGKQKVYSIGPPDYYDSYGETILHNPLPDYSEDITAAMEVFDKLRNSHEWCCLTIKSDYMYCWDVSLTPAERSPTDKHEPTIRVTGESLPMAICMAALKSVEK